MAKDMKTCLNALKNSKEHIVWRYTFFCIALIKHMFGPQGTISSPTTQIHAKSPCHMLQQIVHKAHIIVAWQSPTSHNSLIPWSQKYPKIVSKWERGRGDRRVRLDLVLPCSKVMKSYEIWIAKIEVGRISVLPSCRWSRSKDRRNPFGACNSRSRCPLPSLRAGSYAMISLLGGYQPT